MLALCVGLGNDIQDGPWDGHLQHFESCSCSNRGERTGLRSLIGMLAAVSNENGFMPEEQDELLSQGVKPWDEDALSVLDALNGDYNYY
mmetsp:Transcript_9995/g.20987  ORF Transcript_9995/g.20987 Transcript_9995/m.20987 type:complete len:89 (-) Transcript_9995:155-421(-)